MNLFPRTLQSVLQRDAQKYPFVTLTGPRQSGKSTIAGREPSLWFWRDGKGNEVDLVDCTGGEMRLVEIKSGATYSNDFWRGIVKCPLSATVGAEGRQVIYAGETSLKTTQGNLLAWPFPGPC